MRWQVNGKETLWRPVWVAPAKALNLLIEFRAFLLQELLLPLTGVSIERPDSRWTPILVDSVPVLLARPVRYRI